MSRNWVEWHEAYERPESSLATRLGIVVEMLSVAFAEAPAGDVRCLSLCAGDARDLATALADSPRAGDAVGAVVELDERLAASARDRLAQVAPGLQVRCGDAADLNVFADVAPVDVLLLVGIFGNIVDDDIRRTIAAVPSLCRPNATVLWSRHRREPDATPMIRTAFDAVGCESIRYESPGARSFAIGAERWTGTAISELPSEPLFSFRTDLW